MNANHIVISKRWDGIGGRLNSLVNAMSLAKALELEFKFTWPRGRMEYLDDPTVLFHPDFLAAYEVNEEYIEKEFQHCPLKPEATLLDAALSKIMSAKVNVYIKNHECFRVVQFKDEGGDEAYRRFRSCFDLIKWNDTVEQLKSVFANWSKGKQISTLHIRAGDIVTGEWKNFIAYQKYTPTPYILATLNELTECSDDHIIVVSDNESFQLELKRQFGERVLIPKDIYAQYNELSFVHKALADILLLSEGRNIYSSPFSAFSRIAANICGGKLHNINKLSQQTKGRELLFQGIANELDNLDEASFTQPLIARDICWAVDVFGDDINPAENTAWAEKAVELEPDLPPALCRLARAEALYGNFDKALSLGSKSISIARGVEIHKDPLVESLCTYLAVSTLAVMQKLLSKAPLDEIKILLGEYQTLAKECESNKPYQMDYAGLLHNLRFQRASIEFLAGHYGGMENATFSTELRLEFPAEQYQFAPIDNMADEHRFDPVLRFTELASVKLSQLTGQYVKDYGRNAAGTQVETDVKAKQNQSKTGLQWIWGTVSNPIDWTAAAFFDADRRTYYASPLFRPQSEPVNQKTEPASLVQEFYIPTPIDCDINLQSDIQLFAVSPMASRTKDSLFMRLYHNYGSICSYRKNT